MSNGKENQEEEEVSKLPEGLLIGKRSQERFECKQQVLDWFKWDEEESLEDYESRMNQMIMMIDQLVDNARELVELG